jgi:hypothetical protein
VESNNTNNYEATGIIVGEDLEKAKGDSLALQGLSYEKPIPIYNSTNFYLPLSAKTFKESRKLSADSEAAGDFYTGWFNYVNVLFLDKDYKVIGILLDKKASISEIETYGVYYNSNDNSRDTTVKNIAYLIGYEDSNNDGKLDHNDFHDLFISDLNGGNLTMVTKEKDIIDYDFIKSNSEIFIRYLDRNDLRDEYKRTKFGLFHIVTREFRELKDIEESLIEIESSLIR